MAAPECPSDNSTDVFPVVGDGGLDAPVAAPADPFHALDDLMAVVEELCPVWPPRDTFKNEMHNRL